MNCKLCKTEMYPIYVYQHDIPEVIPFKVICDYAWRDVELYICPTCGSVFGKVHEND